MPTGYQPFFDRTRITPAYAALKDEGYNVTVISNDTLSDKPAITIPQFLKYAATSGVFMTYGHGGQGGDWFPIEIYKSARAWGQRILSLAKKGYSIRNNKGEHGDITGGPIGNESNVAVDPSFPKESWAVGLTVEGFEHHLHMDPSVNSLVYLSGCETAGMEAAFPAARQFFGYKPEIQVGWEVQDVQTFWSDLDGSLYPDADLGDPRTRLTSHAFSDCSSNGHCGLAELTNVNRPMTLAPAVNRRDPDPKKDGPVVAGTDVPITVAFDTVMDTNPPADSVVTVDGCGAAVKTPFKWQDNQTITGAYTAGTVGQLTITVHADQAKSKDTEVPLDGNTGGAQEHDGAIAPNGDDFVWKVPCIQPYLTSVEYASTGAHFDLDGSYQTGPFHDGATLIWDETFDLTEGGANPQGQLLGPGLQAGPPEAGGGHGSFTLSGKDDNATLVCQLLPFAFESPQLRFDRVEGSGSSIKYYLDVWMDVGTAAPFTGGGCNIFAGTVNIPAHQTEVQFALQGSDHPRMHTREVLANLMPLGQTLSDTDTAGQTTTLTQRFVATVTVSGYW